jgi:hypothetical protein
MVFATSDADGRTWSKEIELTPPLPEKTSAYTAMGIRAVADKLIAYYGHYAYTDLCLDQDGLPDVVVNGNEFRFKASPTEWCHRDIFTAIRISSDRGATWSAPSRILERFVPNLRPFPTRSGRLIMTGNVTFPHTDNPAGTGGWESAGLPRLPIWIADDPEGFHKGCYFRGDLRNYYCEASFYQTVDGIIHMMLRTISLPPERHNGLLAVTESRDDGETWSEPMMTTYTDCSCRFHFGRLPDGRFFGLSCPNPRGPRTPLVLALSKDGIVFNQHFILGETRVLEQLPGMLNRDGYGYPTCDIAEGKMYIAYSRGKRDIYFMKLDLKTLS